MEDRVYLWPPLQKAHTEKHRTTVICDNGGKYFVWKLRYPIITSHHTTMRLSLWTSHLRRASSRLKLDGSSRKTYQCQSAVLQGPGCPNLAPLTFQCLQHSRLLSSHSPQLVSPDGVVRSPLEDLKFPEDLTLHELVFDLCDKNGDTPAMEDFLTGKRYTYTEIKAKSIKVANALHAMGYRKDDLVMVFAANRIDFTIAFLACVSLGIWFSAYNPVALPEELARALTITRSKAVFTTTDLLPVVKKALEETDPTQVPVKDIFIFGEETDHQHVPFNKLIENDGTTLPQVAMDPKTQILAQLFSSGTTALPKCAQLSHYNFVTSLLQTNRVTGYSQHERFDGLLPLYHIYGLLVKQLLPFSCNGFTSLLPKFEPETFLQCLQDAKVSVLNTVPPLVHFLANHPIVDKYDLSTIHTMVSAAAPLGKEVMNQFRQRFPNVQKTREGFGMTEILVVTYNTLDVPNSVGSLVPNTYGKVVDPDTGVNLGPGQVGELCFKGPQTMIGYFKNPEANKAMIKPDGWVHTGDIGYYSEEGLFYITDRIKDLIKYQASQVAPAELENILHGHPGVLDVAVIGIPDATSGEVPKAFVVKTPKSTVTDEELMDYVKENANKTMWLRGGVTFLEAIPKSPSGKILKRVLRDM